MAQTAADIIRELLATPHGPEVDELLREVCGGAPTSADLTREDIITLQDALINLTGGDQL